MKKVLITVMAMIMLAAIAGFAGAQEWFDSNWGFRRPITIANPSNPPVDLTNHQVQVKLDSSFNFGSALPGGSDLRITESDGVTPIPFWIETWDSATMRASIWVKVPALPLAGTSIYLYYGNSLAASASSGADAFTVYDGFEANSVGSTPVAPVPDPGYWSKYAGNPVIPNGFGSTFFDSSTGIYHNFVSYGTILHYTSPDGLNWTPDAAHNPVLTPTQTWEGDNVGVPMAWKEGATWYMLYRAGSPNVIGLATSTDAVIWTHRDQPVLVGDPGAWDSVALDPWGVIKVGDTYYMWYNTIGGAPGQDGRCSGLATSTNLIDWTKDPHNPIFSGGRFCPFPFKYGDNYYLLIPHYTSGTDYSQHELYRDVNPTFYPGEREYLGVAIQYGPATWDGHDQDTPAVLTDTIYRDTYAASGNQLWVYYAGESGGAWQTGMTIEEDIAAAIAGVNPATFSWSATGAVTVVDSPVRQGVRAVLQRDTSASGSVILSGSLPSQPSGAISAWMRRSSNTVGDYDIYLYGAQLSCVAGLGRNGDFHFWNGAFQATGIPWAPNTWYLVTLAFNAATQRYDFMVHNEALEELVHVEYIAFGRVSTVISSAQLYTSGGFVEDGFADDFRLRPWCGADAFASVGAEEAYDPDNTAPIADDQTVSAVEDTALAITLTASDAEEDPLAYTIVSTPSHGTLTGTGPGLTYTPALNYYGPDSFTFTANDGTVDSNIATVAITVNAVNDAPFAAADSFSASEGTLLEVGAPGVLGNDLDVDSVPLTAVLTTGPSHGTLALNANGSFTYDPAAGYNGPDGFDYRAFDGEFYSGTVTVTITVISPNVAPAASNDAYSTDQDSLLSVPAPGVLGNDSDADADPVTAVLVESPSQGSLTLNTDGSFAYTPSPGFSGTDGFTYKANDGVLDSNIATVTITVNAVSPSWLNEDWDFRIPVAIASPSGSEVADYPVRISLGSSFDFGHARLDGSDVRVTRNNGSTEIPFWIEKWDPTGGSAEIWVRVPSIPVHGTSIYLYYGNTLAASASSGTDAFTVYDGFEANSVGSTPVASVLDAGYWSKYAGNPVIPNGFGSTFFDSSTGIYHNFVSYGTILHYTSPDGITWTPDAAHNPVLAPTQAWEGGNVGVPMAWKEGGTWYMLYRAGSPNVIGLATSTDAVTWTHRDQPVLVGDPGAWDSVALDPWGVIKVGDTYYMWYNTIGGAPGQDGRCSGLATSTNLIDWTKDPHNPIFSGGRFCPFPFKYGDNYYLLIPHYSSGSDYSQIELYRDVNPTFYAGEREYLGVAIQYGPSVWDGHDQDTPAVLTDTIYRDSYAASDNQLWVYYAGESGGAWQTGMTIEEDIAAAIAGVNPATFSWSATGAVTVVDSPVRQGVRSVLQRDASTGTVILSGSLPSQPSGAVSAWMRRSSNTAGDYDIYLYGEQLSCVAGLGRNGDFHFWNGTFQPTGIPWAPNTWYLVTLAFNAATQRYDFMVHNEAFEELVSVEDIAFGHASTSISSAQLYTSGGFIEDGFADDFRLRPWCGADASASAGTEEALPNTAPVANDDSVITAENTAITIDVAANDTDEDGNIKASTAALVNGSGPTHGAVVNNGDGTFTYTPDADYGGSDSFSYQICDIQGLCDTATVNISIIRIPPEPTFVSLAPNNGASSAGVPIEFTLTVGDGDGFADIRYVTFMLREGGPNSSGISVHYRGDNYIRVWSNTLGRWLVATLGSAVILEDNLASVDVSKCSVTGNGDLLTIKVSITPKAAYIAPPLLNDKNIWLYLRDAAGHTAQPQIGTWRAFEGLAYTLTMGVNPAEGGSTSPAVGSHTYSEGVVVPVSATPNSGYRFVSWSGPVAGPNSSTTTVSMSGHTTLTANFEQIPTYSLTMAVNLAEGGVTSPAVGSHTYSEGAAVPVSATPNSGYRFVSWSGPVAEPNAPATTVTVSGDTTITANFEQIPTYSLTMAGSPAEGGITSPAVGSHTYSEGAVVPVSATPNSGYRFVSWSGPVAEPNASATTVTMSGDTTLTANFEQIVTYSITMAASPAEGGVTSPAVGSYTYDQGAVVPVSATPNSGYRFVSWSGPVSDPNASATTVTVSDNATVTANFEATGLPPEPSFVSLVPNNGASAAGVPIEFTLTVGDGDGYADIRYVTLMLREGGPNTSGVAVHYRGDNYIRVWSNTLGRWLVAALGSAVILEDNLASVDVSRCSVTGNGDLLTLKVSITPKAAYIAPPLLNDKKIWLYLRDAAGHTIQPQIGTWRIQ